MIQKLVLALRDWAARTTRTGQQHFPRLTALVGLSFVGFERLGAQATRSRRRRIALMSLAGMLVMVMPVAAQGCGSGPLQFIGDIYALVTRGAGTIIVTMLILAGALKVLPMRGTNSWGNALIGSVIAGVVFLVVGPALLDIADQASPINMNAQCTGGAGNVTD